jgi:hypothetical protein
MKNLPVQDDLKQQQISILLCQYQYGMGAEATLKVYICHYTNTWRNSALYPIAVPDLVLKVLKTTQYPVHLPGLEKKLWSVEKLIAVQHWYAYLLVHVGYMPKKLERKNVFFFNYFYFYLKYLFIYEINKEFLFIAKVMIIPRKI